MERTRRKRGFEEWRGGGGGGSILFWSDRNYSGPETSFSIERGGTPMKILYSFLAGRRRRGGKVRAAGEFFVFRLRVVLVDRREETRLSGINGKFDVRKGYIEGEWGEEERG